MWPNPTVALLPRYFSSPAGAADTPRASAKVAMSPTPRRMAGSSSVRGHSVGDLGHRGLGTDDLVETGGGRVVDEQEEVERAQAAEGAGEPRDVEHLTRL